MRLEDPGTTGSWPVPPVWALVEGAQAASAVWSVMDRWSYPMSLILPGQFLGRRWWLMAAAIELPVPGQVLDVAARADHALLVGTSTPGEGAGGQADGGALVVHTRIDGTWTPTQWPRTARSRRWCRRSGGWARAGSVARDAAAPSTSCCHWTTWPSAGCAGRAGRSPATWTRSDPCPGRPAPDPRG